MKKVLVVIAIAAVLGVFLVIQNKPNIERTFGDDDSRNLATAMPQTSSVPSVNNNYKDGSYTGSVGSASQYGDVQVKVTITGGKITDIQYLQFPTGGGHTAEVTAIAKPALVQEAIQAQSANINIVSGATQDTEGFIQSLQSALDQAKG